MKADTKDVRQLTHALTALSLELFVRIADLLEAGKKGWPQSEPGNRGSLARRWQLIDCYRSRCGQDTFRTFGKYAEVRE